MIAVDPPARTGRMVLTGTIDWLAQNREGLLLGLAVGLFLVAFMLLLRSYGQRIIARDPAATGWRTLVAGWPLTRSRPSSIQVLRRDRE